MTHCDRLLAVLADGRDHLELYRLGMIVHSRVSDLRRRGYAIEQHRDGDRFLYRLVGTPEEGAAGAAEPVAASSSGAPAAAVPPDDGAPDLIHADQLSLEVAA